MIPVLFDYATPSVFESDRARTLLGMAVNARRPVRFHGRVTRNIPLLRFTLRALGETVWSNDLWASADEIGGVLDPVITVHPDRLFFEAFSQDQSVYAMVIVNPGMFETEGEVRAGTTNVDFTAWLWAALNELRSSRETWLRIEAGGFEVKTARAGGRFQQKVELPDAWVRGFLQVSGAMAMPGTRLTVRPADLLAAIRFLRYTKARLSPRALRYEFLPGQDARIVLEPWEHVVPLRGAEHNYTEPRVIRTWGRRRLSLIEPLLPFATQVDIYLKGRSLPSFYAVKLPDLTFVLGLSGWSDQAWTGAGSFDLLGEVLPADSALVERVRAELAAHFTASPKELAQSLAQPVEAVWRACARLCRQGRAVFDVETRAFRHRELFEQPIEEARLFPPDVRLERAAELIAQKAVRFAACEPQETRKVKKLGTPDGPVMREIVYRDWRVTGAVGDQTKIEIVVGDTGRIIFGTCGCSFFRENLLSKGPCEHMIALFRVTAEARKDLPTSEPAPAEAVAPPLGAPPSDAEADEPREEVDEENDEEKNENT
jgi:hypothetical protein